MLSTIDYELAAEQTLYPTEANKLGVSLTAFKERIYRRYLHAPHLAALDDLLTQVTRYTETGGAEGVGRAIIEMPPRHGKTLTTSRLFPTWHLGRNPDHRIMLVSYGATLAEKNSRAARNILNSPVYRMVFPDIAIAHDSKAVDAWNIAEHEGGVDALGIGGGATGKGAHVLIIDDPHKDRAEVESEVMREKVWDAYGDDLYTRLEPAGAIIVMATRWHQDDLIGRLLTNEPDEWFRLRLPALAEKDDALGRAVGEALWEARYPRAVLLKTEQLRGAYTWNSLYQQRPMPAEGGLFKRAKFNIINDEPADIERRVRFWDLALSERTSADYTVGVEMGMTVQGRLVVLDVKRFQKEWDDVVPEIAKVAVVDTPKKRIGVETAFFQSRAVKKLLVRPELHMHSVTGYKPDTDKFTRALPFAARVGEGMVDVLRRSWTEAYIEELTMFPNAAHDDQVDASSGAYLMLDGSGELSFGQAPPALADFFGA